MNWKKSVIMTDDGLPRHRTNDRTVGHLTNDLRQSHRLLNFKLLGMDK